MSHSLWDKVLRIDETKVELFGNAEHNFFLIGNKIKPIRIRTSYLCKTWWRFYHTVGLLLYQRKETRSKVKVFGLSAGQRPKAHIQQHEKMVEKEKNCFILTSNEFWPAMSSDVNPVEIFLESWNLPLQKGLLQIKELDHMTMDDQQKLQVDRWGIF